MDIFLLVILFLMPAIFVVVYALLRKYVKDSAVRCWIFSYSFVTIMAMSVIDAIALATLFLRGSAYNFEVFLTAWVLVPIIFAGSLPSLHLRKQEEPVGMIYCNVFCSGLLVWFFNSIFF